MYRAHIGSHHEAEVDVGATAVAAHDTNTNSVPPDIRRLQRRHPRRRNQHRRRPGCPPSSPWSRWARGGATAIVTGQNGAIVGQVFMIALIWLAIAIINI